MTSEVIVMYVDKGSAFLSDVSFEELEKKYNAEKNAKAKIRLQCALLRKKGNSIPFISDVIGKRESTVSDILRRFARRGIGGCYAIRQKGQPPKLSLRERLLLKKALSKSPQHSGLPFVTWTTKLVAYFIKHEFSKEIVPRHVQRIVKSFNMSIQIPRPEHMKANKKLQREFKKNFGEGLRDLCRQDMRSPFWTRASSP